MNSRALWLVLALSLVLAGTASAHATILDCAPAIGANLPNPPGQLVCHFTEPLIAAKSALKVSDAQGQRVDNGDTKMYQGDPTRLIVTLDTSKMTTGLYTVHWSVTSTNDNAVTENRFQFGLRTPVPPTATPVLPGNPVQPPATVDTTGLIARLLIGGGMAVGAGTVFLMWRNGKSSGLGEG